MLAVWILLGALALFVAVVLVRALLFRPVGDKRPPAPALLFDGEAAVSALAQLVRCKTVSYYDKSLEDEAEFERLLSLLPTLYPHVFEVCSVERLEGRGLLLCWQGRAHDAPTVLMAHYDVVPADAAGWEKPPFEGVIADGYLWGRGTLDTKVTLNAALSAANHLIAEGFVPEQDIYFAFSGSEEISGTGAVHIVERFAARGITPAMVLDEGGAVVEGAFPGLKAPCAYISIAEKGMMNVTLSVASQGGHASTPPKITPIGRLSRACCVIEKKPFPMKLNKPAAAMFGTLGRYSGFLLRVIFANLWAFRGVLDAFARKAGGEINAMLRTTVAFTQASGSSAPNVLPPQATMTANLRLNPEDSVASATARLTRLIHDKQVTLTVDQSMEPSRVSVTDCPAWERLASAVCDTWQGCVVSP
ncbi:MAG: M20/M25/M40 family metallo-hydrolase, partial [Clostridia bacterium]|nr:M20/M25/M40 family metallo-hydrolase [Clostridia bacterium]